MYTRKIGSRIAISATSIDDILMATNSKAESDLTTAKLNDKFTLTDGSKANWILGCAIMRWRQQHVLKVDQEQFVVCILKDFGMDTCNPTVTPCPKWRLTSEMCPSIDKEKQHASTLPYCAIVGKCMYLAMCTRPDISYAVRELA